MCDYGTAFFFGFFFFGWEALCNERRLLRHDTTSTQRRQRLHDTTNDDARRFFLAHDRRRDRDWDRDRRTY